MTNSFSGNDIVKTDNYIVKISRKNVNKMKKERDILNELNKFSFSPNLIKSYIKKDYGFLVIQKYKNKKLDLKKLKGFVENLAKVISKIHSIEKEKFNSKKYKLDRSFSTSYDRQFEYFNELNHKSIKNSKYQKFEVRLDVLYDKIKNKKDEIVFSHNDIHLANVINSRDGKINNLIDWELSSFNDYHFDLCSSEIRIIDLYSSITDFEASNLRNIFRSSYCKDIDEKKLNILKEMYLIGLMGNLSNSMDFTVWNKYSDKNILQKYENIYLALREKNNLF